MKKFRFYIRMDGVVYGPYSLDEYRDLDVPDDVEVMEDSVQEWHLASEYPSYEELKAREGGFLLGEDGVLKKVRTPIIAHRVNDAQIVSSISSEQSRIENVEPVRGWNWGAFFFNWIWGLFNGVYWPLLFFICCFFPTIGSIFILAGSIALGVKGNEWSWQNKKWSSAKAFNDAQHKWAMAVLWYIAIIFVLFIIIAVAASNQ